MPWDQLKRLLSPVFILTRNGIKETLPLINMVLRFTASTLVLNMSDPAMEDALVWKNQSMRFYFAMLIIDNPFPDTPPL